MDAQYLNARIVTPLIPARPRDGHKGTFGHLFVVAGSRGFTGAAKLTCLAAGRSGAGLVTAGIPAPLGDVVAAGLLEAMTFLLPATDSEALAESAVEPALAFAAEKDAVVLGPGLSQHDETVEFVREFVRAVSVPLLVDADGLNALAGHVDRLRGTEHPIVLTPHPGEMARLCGVSTQDVQANRVGTAHAFAREHACVVVLKGRHTVIAEPGGDVWLNPTGNPGMATGGTGDVLSGLIGGLLAQGLPAFDAARLGAYLHGLAGDIAAQTKTEPGLIAGDVVEAIPAAWRQLGAV